MVTSTLTSYPHKMQNLKKLLSLFPYQVFGFLSGIYMQIHTGNYQELRRNVG
jgi:hypothetical protein